MLVYQRVSPSFGGASQYLPQAVYNFRSQQLDLLGVPEPGVKEGGSGSCGRDVVLLYYYIYYIYYVLLCFIIIMYHSSMYFFLLFS